MGKRFSDIKRGAELEAARVAYFNYWETKATRPSGVGTGTPRELDAVCYVQPFTTDVAADEVVTAKAYNQGYTTLSTYINGVPTAAVTNTIGANSIVNIPKFRAARVTWFRNTTRQVSTPTSKFTNQEYLKYTGERFSCPFGATADTDDMIDSFLSVKAALLAVSGYAVSRVSLKREEVGIEAA